MKSGILDAIKFLIGWPLSILSLFFVLKIIQPKLSLLLPQLQNINWQLLIWGIFCFLIYFLLRGILWNELLKLKGYKISFKESLYLWNISELKRYTPGNIWSFLSRAILFSEKKVQKKDVLKSLLFESQLIIAGTTIVSLFSLPFVFNILPDTLIEPIIQPLIFTAAIALSLIFIFNPRKFSFLPTFKWLSNLKLLVISSFLFFLWGLGNYLVASSLFILDPSRLLEFVGFFVFALLVGYLSFITPMGLGVREGVLTFGFSKILTVELAGFISIFVRVVFIISELIFLFLSWVWKNTKSKFVLKIESLVLNHKHETILLLLIFVYFFYFTSASFLRFDNFYTGRFDLGNMDQTVWNTSQGRIFELTDPNGTNIISRLAFHADFILILISPLYWIWSSPKMLLLLQTLIVSAGAIFIYLISQHALKKKNISLFFSLIFLLNPALQYSNLYDFHPVVLATTFLLATFYFLIKKRYSLFLLFLFLSVLTKEDVWIIAALFGLYILFFLKRRVFGFLIFLISIISFYYLIWHFIPAQAEGKHFALSYFSDFGDSPDKIIKNIILNPLKTLPIIVLGDRLEYFKQILLPLGFLPVFSAYIIFALPSLLINTLSSNSQLQQIYYQYTSVINPFVFISAIFAVRKIILLFPKITLNILISYLLLTAFYSVYFYGPLPGSKKPSIEMFTKPLENREVIDKILSKIPKGYSVSSTNDLGSHLSQREKIHTVPITNSADIVAFLIRKDTFSISRKEELETLGKIKNDRNYLEIFKDGEFIIFQKRSLPRLPI